MWDETVPILNTAWLPQSSGYSRSRAGGWGGRQSAVSTPAEQRLRDPGEHLAELAFHFRVRRVVRVTVSESGTGTSHTRACS